MVANKIDNIVMRAIWFWCQWGICNPWTWQQNEAVLIYLKVGEISLRNVFKLNNQENIKEN